MREILNDWTDIQKLWDDAYVDSSKRARESQSAVDNAESNVNNTDHIQYSIRSKFYEEYDKWDGKDPRVKFNVGTTSNALKTVGVKEADIIMDSNKLIKIKSKHPEMTDDVIKKIPELLEHPMIIMESNSVPGRLVVYGDVSSNNGPVMTALELNPTQRGYAVNSIIKVASAYTRNNTQNYIYNCKILWVYDKKIRPIIG